MLDPAVAVEVVGEVVDPACNANVICIQVEQPAKEVHLVELPGEFATITINEPKAKVTTDSFTDHDLGITFDLDPWMLTKGTGETAFRVQIENLACSTNIVTSKKSLSWRSAHSETREVRKVTTV